jgi:cytidine deaminase
MQKEHIHIELTRYDSIKDLNAEEQRLTHTALAVAHNAYAPYSKFKVGAAILLDNGEVVTGSNQENAAYPSGLCAERVALFWAGSQFPESAVKTMVIVSVKEGELVSRIVAPCGACRQVINEASHRYKKPFSLLLVGKEGILKVENANDLLPLSFGPEDL